MAAELATLMWSLVRAISACHPGLDLPHMQRSHCNTLYILLSIPSSKATVKPNLEMLIGCDEGAGLACQTVEDVNREIMVFICFHICFHMFSSRSSLAMSTSSMQNQVHSGSFRFIQVHSALHSSHARFLGLRTRGRTALQFRNAIQAWEPEAPETPRVAAAKSMLRGSLCQDLYTLAPGALSMLACESGEAWLGERKGHVVEAGQVDDAPIGL